MLESAKALLCSAPALAAPNFTHSFKLEVDASACGAGAVLLQEEEQSIDHPICYFSKNYSVFFSLPKPHRGINSFYDDQIEQYLYFSLSVSNCLFQ